MKIFNKDACIIICSTPFSKRLPEKCFKLINGKTAFSHLICRIGYLNYPIGISLPDCLSDGEIAEYFISYCNENFYNKKLIRLHYGSIESPLHRMEKTYHEICKEYDTEFKYIIRITHDDILIDSLSIIEMVERAKKFNFDYCYAKGIVEGAGVEIINARNLINAAEIYKNQNIEHISYYVKNINNGVYMPRESIQRKYRLTLDYYEDYIVLENIFRNIGNNSSVDKICEYIDNNPMIMKYNELPDISFYTCVKDNQKWIGNCIESVLITMKCNSFKSEYIIIDDCSTDKTLEKIIEKIGLWDIKNVKLIINEKNQGLSSSSNIALNNAKGKYICRIDGDDMLFPRSIQKMINMIEYDNSIIVYPSYNEIDENNLIDYMKIKGDKYHHAGCALMDKKIINEIRFKDGLKHWDSLELYNRIKKNNFKMSYYDDVGFNYRIHTKNMSKNNIIERELIKKEIEEEYGRKENNFLG